MEEVCDGQQEEGCLGPGVADEGRRDGAKERKVSGVKRRACFYSVPSG